MSVLELAKLISNNYSFIPMREGESEITFADITKAKTILGWEPQHRIETFIKDNLLK